MMQRNSGNIRMVIRAGLISVFLTFITYVAVCQVEDTGSIDNMREEYCEELYTVSDRDLYIAGETVWLKIFKLNSLTRTPSDMSKVVYTDILDAGNNPVTQSMALIEGVSGPAYLKLPDTLSTGYYVLRSYTNWMKNFSPDLFSYRKIAVINPFEDIEDITLPPGINTTDSVVFCTEGGNLVAGLETKVGLKTLNRDGYPVSTEGALIYDDNDTIARIYTGRNGYGWLSFIPSPDRSMIYLTTGEGPHIKKFSLTGIDKEGIIISVTEDTGVPIIRIVRSPGYNEPERKLFLNITSPGLKKINREIFTNTENNEILLYGYGLPAGLSCLTVTDNQGEIIANRWIHNRKEGGIHFEIDVKETSPSVRDRITIEIRATDENGNPVETDMFLSVAKRVTVEQGGFNNIEYRQMAGMGCGTGDTFPSGINDHLLFFSFPGITVGSDQEKTMADEMLLPELESHIIKGTIRERSSGKPMSDEQLSLAFVGEPAICSFTRSDESGNFRFVTKEHGLREIVIQPAAAESDYFIEVNNPFFTSYNHHNHTPFFLDTSRLGEINNVVVSMQINSIYEPFISQDISQRDIPAPVDFFGIPDKSILMSDYIGLTSVREVIKEILPGVYTSRRDNNSVIKITNEHINESFETDPLVLVDGTPVYDIDRVLEIPSDEIRKIDVVNTRYYISDVVLEGILNIVSQQGNLNVLDFDKYLFRRQYNMPQAGEDFYSPDYSGLSQADNHLPDFRNTLYCNPSLHTGKNGKTEISFYTSDERTEYTIFVEGITSEGLTGSAARILTVD